MVIQPLPDGFDPYSDRTARDIRNTLSKAFVRALEAGRPEPFAALAEKWLKTGPPAPCTEFIQDRLPRYGAVLKEIKSTGITDPLHRAVVIWNYGLFFEVHEQVEDFWHESAGGRHRALQGLILAAGVYVHLEAGNRSAAEKLAQKAARLLDTHGRELSGIANLKTLMEKIQPLDSQPPRLEISQER